jgi:hypothetical protein
MPSSVPLETPLAAWAGLARLREISRLVLASIELDDLDAVARLAGEGDTIIRSLEPLFGSRADLDPEIRLLLEDVSRGHQRIVECLAERRAQTSTDLAALRASRGKLRALRLNGPAQGGASVDRTT